MSDFVVMPKQDVNEIPKRGGSRRKALIIDKKQVIQSAAVEQLANEKLVLSCEFGKAHFQRLRYLGCPVLTKKGELDPTKQYIDMGRNEFAFSMYRLLQPNFNYTTKGYFHLLIEYIRWMDEKQYGPVDGDYFHNQLIDAYMVHWGELVTAGAKKSAWGRAKQALSFILKQLNRTVDASKLPRISDSKKETLKTQGLDVDAELKPLIKAYFRAFTGFEKCMKQGIFPTIHPLWDEALFNEQALLHAWTPHQKGCKKDGFRKSIANKGLNASSFTWINQFSRIAAMIVFIFTGQNTTPLLNLRHGDVNFDEYQLGKVYLNMEKARAQYLSIDTSIGFSPYAKRFIETWLALSIEIQKNSDTDWLFPYVKSDGTVCSLLCAGNSAPQQTINKLTSYLGLAYATPRILRQTKIDTLMRVTEDIYLVSLSANNDVNTIKVNYSHGLAKDHERNLCATNDAMYSLAKGAMVEDAVLEAKFRYHDVLSEYDYRQLIDWTLRAKSFKNAI